jgi:DNA-binding response OmpR family regulator
VCAQGIALSGYGMDDDLQRSADAGFELHLTKPVHFASLSAAIHALFQKHQQLKDQQFSSAPPPPPDSRTTAPSTGPASDPPTGLE